MGDLVAYLERKRLRERTLIVFLSDNGYRNGPGEDFSARGLGGPKGKASAYELGLRTPIIFSWPGRIPAGLRDESLVSSLDLFPTLLDYADTEPPPGRIGQNLRPILEGRETLSRDAIIGWMEQTYDYELVGEELKTVSLGPAFFLRNRSWRLILPPGQGTRELYQMRTDPDQTRNLIAEQPELAAKLRRQIEAWEGRLDRTLEESRPRF